MPPGEKALTSLFISLQHIMSSISLQLLFFFFLVYRTSLKHSRELSICHFAGFLLSQPEIQMIQFAFKEKSSMFLLLLQLLFLENILLVATTHIGKIFDRNLGNIRCYLSGGFLKEWKNVVRLYYL
jgi:hypothetical protein